MKKLMLFALLATSGLLAQTVYLRDSAPAAVPVCGATNATPIVIFTCADHGLSVGDFVGVNGVATGTGVSPANGIRTVIASGSNDHNHFAIGDLSGTPIAGTGLWFDGSSAPFVNGAQWVGKLHPYTLGAQPLGWLDGASGPRTRQVALWTGNGLTSLVVASNVATITTSFDYGMSSGDKLGIWSSGISALDNSHNPYTVTRVDSTHYTFTTSGVSNGSYAASNAACGPAGTPNDTIGGTLPCLRLSQRAWIGNPIWDGLEAALIVTNMVTGTEYKNIFHGGKNISGFNAPGWYANVAVKFLVDPTNTQMFAAGMYNFNNLEFLAGVNWVGNEKMASGGNADTNDFLSYYANGLAMVYSVFSPYASAAHKTTFLNKIYNDSDDPSVGACSSVNGDVGTGHNDILSTGLAQSGSTGTTIVLASADAHADNFYVNNVIQNANNQMCLVTGYTASTKTATCSAAWTAPVAGDAYTIYATITVASSAGSNSTGIVTTAVTGYNTHFLSRTSLGDALEGENFWELNPDASSSYVSATVTSDTSLTVINSWNPVTSTTVPSIVWYFPKWQPGDCGMVHRNKYWLGSPGAQPAVYHGGGGQTAARGGGPANVATLAIDGANNVSPWAAAHLVMDIVMAADDSRAIRDLQTAQSFGFDYELRHYMNYGCPAHSGTAYNYANTLRGVHEFAETLAMIPGFPDMDLAGPWIAQCSISGMFFTYPDQWWLGHIGVTGELRYGTETENGGSGYQPKSLPMIGVTQDPIFNSAPLSNNATWFRNFLERTNSVSLWGGNGVNYDYNFANVLHSDPRIVSSDYTVQPTQYAFKQSSNVQCASLTGWPCPVNFRGDSMASRGGAWTDLTSSLVYYGTRTWWGDHDNPENGTLRIYDVGELLTTDFSPPGGQCSACNPDQTTMGDLLQIGGSKASLIGGAALQTTALAGTATAGMTPITRWGAQYAGALGAAYGDQNSKYAYVCSDLAGVYTVPINHDIACVVHFKKASTDQFVVHHIDVDVTGNPTPLEAHIHYAQSGDGATAWTYPEGQTTCPGAGSCLSLNTNRAIQSLQDGGTNGVTARTFGILSNFVSPSTITLRDDAAVNTIAITSVRKTATVAISSYVTGSGFITTVNTVADHNLVSGEIVMFTAVVGTGCTGTAAFNNGVFTWPVTVTGARGFTIPFDSRSICTSPSSGNVTSITLFNATGHGLINGATVKVAGATGSWAAWNQAGMLVEVVDADHFNEYWPSSPDTSAYGTAFDGTITKFYPGGFGYTHRISICGGGTCGASTNGLEYIVVHKIANGLSDTSLTTTAMNPDTNWTGAQMCGARSCAVYLGARHGVTQSTMAGFTTTHSGTAQYLIGGVTAGSGYAITINGTPVAGSPFTVAAGDNSIEFESTAGTVSLNGGSPPVSRAPVVGGKVSVGGHVVIH